MFTELNEKLLKAQEGISRLQKINAILNGLESEKSRLEQKSHELQSILNKENEDVKKIENQSIVSFFYSVLGSLPERIDKERKEALAAKLKYDQCIKDLQNVLQQIEAFNEEKKNYTGCRKEYDLLYARKKEALVQSSEETAQKILELSAEKSTAQIRIKEIEEAIYAGKRVICSLNNAIQNLSSAEGWGTWDLLGGGLITDLVKHSHIDNAKAETENTQILLRQFKSELTDIRIDSEICIQTDGFAKFADFFFDGLIADWCMQSKIKESMQSVCRVKNQVADILQTLEQMHNHDQNAVTQTDHEINAIVLNER